MEVIVHYSLGVESKQILSRQVAVIYAQAVIKYMDHLPCPRAQKLQLLKALKEFAK
ncbi:MAG: hypothetical protein RSL74_08740 [Clostridium sp.]